MNHQSLIIMPQSSKVKRLLQVIRGVDVILREMMEGQPGNNQWQELAAKLVHI